MEQDEVLIRIIATRGRENGWGKEGGAAGEGEIVGVGSLSFEDLVFLIFTKDRRSGLKKVFRGEIPWGDEREG